MQYRHLPAALILLGILSGKAWSQQAAVLFNNRSPAGNVSAPIFEEVIGGTPLQGAAFRARLYGGPAGTPEHKLLPVGPSVDFRADVTAGFVNVGVDGSRSVPGVAPGGTVTVQIRAWSLAGGSTYEEARNNGASASKIGRSNPLTLTTQSSLLLPPVSLTGLQSFAIKTPRTPPLTLLLHTGSTLLSWAADGIGYVLETTDSLGTPTDWQPVDTIVQLLGSNLMVSLPMTDEQQRFYRLRLP